MMPVHRITKSDFLQDDELILGSFRSQTYQLP